MFNSPSQHRFRLSGFLTIGTLAAATLLASGCGSQQMRAYTDHQNTRVLPGRSATNDLAIAFRLDEFAPRESVIASAMALDESGDAPN